MPDDFDESIPDTSEQFDQPDPEQSLVDRGIADQLDEGYAPPDGWSPGEGFGNTAAEMRQGETLEMRMKQEVPDSDVLIPDEDERPAGGESEDGDYSEADEFLDDSEVGGRRAGRLVDANHGYPGEDTESEMIGEDVGIDGAAASAEEAAMHIVGEADDDIPRRY